MNKRLEAALQIRDAALQKLQAEGQVENMKNHGPVLSWYAPDWREGGIHMLHRTPEFQTQSTTNLPYGLDIWVGPKVMNLEWSDSGDIKLVSFKRGAWEQTVLSFGKC